MNIPFSKAYRVDLLSLGDKIGLFSGDGPPSTLDTSSLPIGSIYCQTDGTVWKRKGTGAADWYPMISADEVPQGNAGSSGVNTLYAVLPVVNSVGEQNAIRLASLSAIPAMDGNQTITATATNGAAILGAWRNLLAFGRTKIPAGRWTISLSAGVDTVADDRVTWITRRIFESRPMGNTLTMTGSGTSRTVTASSGGSFFPSDVNVNPMSSNFIKTPKGLYPITTYTSSFVVTIVVPSGYVNEVGVSWDKWLGLFNTSSVAIASITPNYLTKTWDSYQPEFTVNAFGRMAAIDFAVAASGGPTEVTLLYNGNQDVGLVTSMSSPLSINNLLTTAGDILVMGTYGVPVRLPAGQAGQVLTSNGAGAAPSWRNRSLPPQGEVGKNIQKQ